MQPHLVCLAHVCYGALEILNLKIPTNCSVLPEILRLIVYILI